jgi:vacuolar protein-sorting-associated protein 4
MKHTLKDEHFRELGALTENFSGSDISILVRDSSMQPIRLVLEATHFKRVPREENSENFENNNNGQPSNFDYIPCSPGDSGAEELSWNSLPPDTIGQQEIHYKHFEVSLTKIKPSVNQADIAQYIKFTTDFGQDG